MAAFLEHALGRLFRFAQRLLVDLFRAPDIGVLAGQHLLVDRAHPLGGLDDVVVDLALAPIQLVHGPRGEIRLFELLHRGVAGFFRERVPRRGEFVERQLIERVDAVVQGGGHPFSLNQPLDERSA